MLRPITLSVLAIIATAPGLHAQGLRDRLTDLFTFGTCGQPLCLDLTNQHGDHFLPAVTAGNQTVIGFVTEAIAGSVANTPISSTSSGATYSIVGGLPVRTSTSAGPIFAERSQTLGRGRFFFGANITSIHYSTLNGAPLDNLEFNFTHQDVGNPGLGDPDFENEVIRLRLGLDVNLLVASVFATWGLLDFVDLGVAVPFGRVSVRGTSVAQIDPFGPTTPHHFGGTDANPILRASRSVDASATGIGDVVGRVKVNLGQGSRFGAAILGEVRFPTGDEQNLLGSGSTTARGVGVLAAQFGSFSVHANGGYVVRTGQLQNDGVLATLGFDNLMTSWATMAFSLISEWQVGEPKLTLPGAIQFVAPFQREIQATTIPHRSGDRLDASLGLKFNVRSGTVLVLNGIAPLRKSSMQPDLSWTAGFEFNF